MPIEQLPEPWRSFLSEIDSNLTRDVDLHCLGGFIIRMVYGARRTTEDVDVIAIVPQEDLRPLFDLAGKSNQLHQKHHVYLDYVPMVTLPENDEQRLTEMFPGAFKHIRLYALDPYDLALSKLERNTQKDRDDVIYLAAKVPLDLDVLRERYEKEMRPYIGVPDREDNTLRLWIDVIKEDRGESG